MQKSMRFLAWLTVGICAVACSQRSEPTPEQAADMANYVRPAGDAQSASASGPQPGSPPANTSNVDPCTFFTKAELESAVGYPLGPERYAIAIFALVMLILCFTPVPAQWQDLVGGR